MMFIEDTGPPEAALPLVPFRAHLRVGTSFGEDDLQDEVLAGFVRAAIAAIEARTGKVLLARAFTLRADLWRDGRIAVLPLAPVTAITGLEIEDSAGQRSAIDPELWRLEPDAHAPRLRAIGAALPRIPEGGAAIISLEAGYGPAWGDMPADLLQAVMMLASHYYEYRHDVSLGQGCMPFGVTSLIERYRRMRLGVGAVR